MPYMKLLMFVVFTALLLIQGPADAKDAQEDELSKQADELSYKGQIDKAQELLGKVEGGDSRSGEAGDGWDMTSMMLSMIWGSIGTGYFIYGKKQSRLLFLLCGIGLCVVPMFVSGMVLNIVIGMGLCIAPFKVDF